MDSHVGISSVDYPTVSWLAVAIGQEGHKLVRKSRRYMGIERAQSVIGP